MFQFSKNLKKFQYIFFLLPAIFFIYHHLINQDFRLMAYDAEPDYIFNGLHILKYKIPINAYHPGTFAYYFISILLQFAELFELSFSQTILFIRSILICNVLLIIAFYLNDSLEKFNKYFLLILLIPQLDFFLGRTGAEIFLFPISIFLIRHIKQEKVDPYLIGLTIAIALSIKMSFIILVPVVLLYLFAKKRTVRYYQKILIVFIISFIIFLLPILPKYLTLIKNGIFHYAWYFSSILGFDSAYYLALLLIFLMILLAISFIKYKVNIKNLFSNIVKRYQIISFFYSFILVTIFSILTILLYYNLVRWVIPLIPVIIECGFKPKFNFHKRYRYVIHIMLIISIFLLNRQKINYNEYTEFDQFVNENDDKVILAFQDNDFHSEYLFREWGQYKYTNSDLIWSQKWNTRHNVQFLNTRNLECHRNPTWGRMSLFNKWYLGHKYLISKFYSPCIINQIKNLEKGDAILTTFNKEQINELKPILLKFGYEMYPKIKFDNFIVWELQNSIISPKNSKLKFDQNFY